MALNWLTVLKIIPWTEVISNAPKVADGAKKLWKAAARKPPAKHLPADENPPQALDARVAALEAATNDLNSQMLASSELIKSLAEQNEQLIARLERQRRSLRWLLVAVLAAGALAAIALLRTVA